MKNIRLIGILATAAFLLLVPFVAMLLGADGVKWSVFDFVIAGVLLLGSGLAIEIVLRIVKRLEFRLAICCAILLGLLIIWAELAVGLIGTRFAGS